MPKFVAGTLAAILLAASIGWQFAGLANPDRCKPFGRSTVNGAIVYICDDGRLTWERY